MSNHEQRSEPDSNQPNQIDQPYKQLDVITRFAAELIALGDRDPSEPIPQPGDLSMLSPRLREYILRLEQDALQEQGDNDTPPLESS